MQFALGFIVGLLAAIVVQAAVERTIDKWRPTRPDYDRGTMPGPEMIGNLVLAARETRQEGAILEPPDDHAQAVQDKIAKADAEGRDLNAEELV